MLARRQPREPDEGDISTPSQVGCEIGVPPQRSRSDSIRLPPGSPRSGRHSRSFHRLDSDSSPSYSQAKPHWSQFVAADRVWGDTNDKGPFGRRRSHRQGRTHVVIPRLRLRKVLDLGCPHLDRGPRHRRNAAGSCPFDPFLRTPCRRHRPDQEPAPASSHFQYSHASPRPSYGPFKLFSPRKGNYTTFNPKAS